MCQQLDRIGEGSHEVGIILKVIGYGEGIVVDHIRGQGSPCVVEAEYLGSALVFRLESLAKPCDTTCGIGRIVEDPLPGEERVHGATAFGMTGMLRGIERGSRGAEAEPQVIDLGVSRLGGVEDVVKVGIRKVHIPWIDSNDGT